MTDGIETHDRSNDSDGDLAFVRRLLDDLAAARFLGVFRSTDVDTNKRLCVKEKQLLRGDVERPTDKRSTQNGQLKYENAHRGVLRRAV
jgi:hypothetical protein